MTIFNLKTFRQNITDKNQYSTVSVIDGHTIAICECFSNFSKHYYSIVDGKTIATRCTYENAIRKACKYLTENV